MPNTLSKAKRDEVLELASRLRTGKTIFTDRYLHFDNAESGAVLKVVRECIAVPVGANVMRIGRSPDNASLSFSQYRDFYEDPFPKLIWSEHHSLSSGAITRRSEGKNPAILHRKELLLDVNHPRRQEFAMLTTYLLQKSLLPTREFIGRHDHWQAYLLSRGYRLVDGSLVTMRAT